MTTVTSLDLTALLDGYRRNAASPVAVIGSVYERLRRHAGNPIWITPVPEAEARARAGAAGDARGTAAACALRRAVRGQGQHRCRRPPHDRRMPRICLCAGAARGLRAT